MKQIFFFVVFVVLHFNVPAQSYSNWITDGNHPNLKVRYKTTKDANGYNFIMLEMQSTVYCKMNVTASLCNADANSRNGWQKAILLKNKSVYKSFKIMNSCTNGFWWWYKDYSTAGVKYDDN